MAKKESRADRVVGLIGLGIKMNGLGKGVDPEHGEKAEKAELPIGRQSEKATSHVDLSSSRNRDPDVGEKKSFQGFQHRLPFLGPSRLPIRVKALLAVETAPFVQIPSLHRPPGL